MAEVSDKYPDVFQYILSEETAFRTTTVPLAENWDWSMAEHIDKSFTLKNSQFTKGANDFRRPFNNIILPIANVNYRTEGFDVKDVEIFVNSKDDYHKSLLTRKFHTKWARKFHINTAIDESIESWYDYGLILVKNVNEERPEIVQMQQIAFCDQTDILLGPLCLKHQYSIDQLFEMSGKWDEDAVKSAVENSQFSTQRVESRETKTPGKYIEVYELHGMFPNSWLKKEDMMLDEGKYSPQIHLVTYFVDSSTKQKVGIQLFKGPEDEPIFKALKRDDIYGRACGRGGIEELFHPQTWTNYSEIHLQQNLEAVSKVVLQTADKKLAKNNKLQNFKHGQIIQYEEGKPLEQVAITAPNKTAFENFINKWEQVARGIGAASDPALGITPVSGTPLGTTEIVTAQGQGIHEYRRGKIAEFWREIYHDWVLSYLVKDMLKGDEWIDELSVDELREVSELVATNQTNDKIKEKLLSGQMVTKEEQAEFKRIFRDIFAKGGRQRFLKLVKDEIKDIPIDVKFNIAGKQLYSAEMVNKLNSVFRAVFANPQMLQNDALAELFNNILESAGLSPLNFSNLTSTSVQTESVVAGGKVDVISSPPVGATV